VVSPEAGRKLLFRFLGWFAMANAVVLALVDLRYMNGGLGEQTWVSLVYLVTVYISHHSWLVLAPLFLLLTPVVLIKPSFSLLKWLAVLLVSLMIAVIVLDSLLWSQSRFHINMLTLKILGLSSWVFVAVMFFIALLFESMLAMRVWDWVKTSASHGGRLLGAVVSVCLLASAGIFAWADASYYVPVTRVAQQLPVQPGFTAKKFLAKHGLVDVGQARERQLARRLAGGPDQSSVASLKYPLEPLQCSSIAQDPKPLNLLIILVDAMRSDMLNERLTPYMYQFAQQHASQFEQHFSGGNSSRMGVFSLLYGLPPGYFGSFEAIQKPPVLIDELTARGYQMGLFSSSTMHRPVALDRTAFSQVPNLRIGTEPANALAWERDRIMTADWLDWLEARDTEKPFFGFLFYDTVNEYLYPPEYKGKITPDPGNAMPQEFADYQIAVGFDDELIGRVLADLEQRDLLDNTVVMITSDHGQEFNEYGNGIVGHGSGYSHYQLQVPMLLAWPGREPQKFDHRSSHYDVPATIMSNLFDCQNPTQDYASGMDMYERISWDWLVAGSYYNYTVVEPHQTTITFPSGRYEVRDERYQLINQPVINADVLEAVMFENSRFHQ
jgi:membrane-anchored protein YejM (alkaline phosphatase superfamily)